MAFGISEIMKVSSGICQLVMPVLCTVFSILFLAGFPKKRNPVFGYRSARSMDSDEAWRLAQRVMKIYFWAYTVLLWAVTAVLMSLFAFVWTPEGGITVMIAECIGLLPAIPITELTLKKRLK